MELRVCSETPQGIAPPPGGLRAALSVKKQVQPERPGGMTPESSLLKGGFQAAFLPQIGWNQVALGGIVFRPYSRFALGYLRPGGMIANFPPTRAGRHDVKLTCAVYVIRAQLV